MQRKIRRRCTPLVASVVLMLVLPATGASASRQHETVRLHLSLVGKSSPPTFHQMGDFKHAAPKAFDHDQFGKARLPIGRFHARRHTPVTSAMLQIGAKAHAVTPLKAPTINLNTSHVAPYDGWVPEEPTTAAYGNTVVYTSNDLISFSVDGGHTFHSFDPRTMFSDSPAGGPDGDQDVIYVPQIGEFVWLIQYFPGPSGANLDRLSVFPPSSVSAGGISSWTSWDIEQSGLPGTDIFFDFPDLAIGNSYLYLTQNPGHGGHPYETFIARIGLSNLQHGLNLAAPPEPWRYIIGPLFMGRVVQNTGSVAYWASNTSTSTMGASAWPESSTSWSGPVNVNVASWPNTDYTTTTPDGAPWLNLYTGRVLAGARIGNDLYFAWTAGRGHGQLSWLTNPHVELAEMTTGFAFVAQRAIWNPSYVFAWPYLTSAPNSQGVTQLGISLVWGGGAYYPGASVGDLTTSPFFVDTDVTSNANSNSGRWGDYLSVHPDYGSPVAGAAAQFVATGYGYDATSPGTVGGYDDHFVAFTG
jgi:hypothetical protein